MGIRRRGSAFLGWVAAWIKPSLHLLSIPGYITDGQAWPVIWRSLGVAMTRLDLILLAVGVPCFIYAFQMQTWPRKLLAACRRDQSTAAEMPGLPEPPPVTLEPRTVTRSTPTPPQPITPDHNTWITEAEALAVVRASSSVQSRLPLETMTLAEKLSRAANFVPSPTGRRRRADEISRHLLRKFESECPWGVRNGTYNSEILREWIDQGAYREDPPTR